MAAEDLPFEDEWEDASSFENSPILLVEDRGDDVFLVRRALDDARLITPIQVVFDGEQAIAYLDGEGKFADRSEYPMPELLLLDLKMPRIDGFEVLRWIGQQPHLSSIRIIVLTSSEDIRDVNLAYQLGAHAFLVKPIKPERFLHTLRCMKIYHI